eukprot:TRINITY_DN63020_c0_g1_i1.p1 TRINITY_DN63020_c0_g1~~TRINITY_DN63020_c0_g1_i1.p1  ORF type:complete len:314 (+),score=41.92 TRINITY_DN63020_c0_g1_i1:120-1061(+)
MSMVIASSCLWLAIAWSHFCRCVLCARPIESETQTRDLSVLATKPSAPLKCDVYNFENGDVLHGKDAIFSAGHVFVVKDSNNPKMRVLAFAKTPEDCHEQSAIVCSSDAVDVSCDASPIPTLSYQNSMLAGLRYLRTNSARPRIVDVGLGGGAIYHALAHFFPKAELTSAELDKNVVEAATKYFGVPESNVVNEDGCSYLKRQADGSIDVFMLDAFTPDNKWPDCFSSDAFFRSIGKKMTQRGLMVVNCWDEYSELIYNKIKQNGYSVKTGMSPGLGNVIYVFSKDPLQEPSVPSIGGEDVSKWFEAAAFHDV